MVAAIGTWIVDAISEVARGMIAPPAAVAQGSDPAITLPRYRPCPTCSTVQRPGAVHFATLAEVRPCAGSWGRS